MCIVTLLSSCHSRLCDFYGRTVGRFFYAPWLTTSHPLASRGVGLTCRSVVHPSSSSTSSSPLSIKLDVKVPVTVFKKTLTLLAQLVRSRPKTLEIVRVWGSKKNRWSSSSSSLVLYYSSPGCKQLRGEL